MSNKLVVALYSCSLRMRDASAASIAGYRNSSCGSFAQPALVVDKMVTAAAVSTLRCPLQCVTTLTSAFALPGAAEPALSGAKPLRCPGVFAVAVTLDPRLNP